MIVPICSFRASQVQLVAKYAHFRSSPEQIGIPPPFRLQSIAKMYDVCTRYLAIVFIQGRRNQEGGTGRSVNPISTGGRGGRLFQQNYYPPPLPDFQTFRRPWDVSHTRHHAGLLLIVSARYAAEPCFFILQSESETFLNSL